jgi:hypothetical protein
MLCAEYFGGRTSPTELIARQVESQQNGRMPNGDLEGFEVRLT